MLLIDIGKDCVTASIYMDWVSKMRRRDSKPGRLETETPGSARKELVLIVGSEIDLASGRRSP